MLLLMTSCIKDKNTIIKDRPEDERNYITTKIGIKGVTGNDGILPENEIRTIDVYSFVQMDGDAHYTFEEQSSDTLLDHQTEFTILRISSRPRILYLIANGVSKISYLSNIQGTKPTLEQFESNVIIRDYEALQTPMTLVSKIELPTPKSSINLDVEMSHTAACIDIENKYIGFTIDSLVLHDAVSGAFLFNTSFPTIAQAPRVRVNYGTQETIYLYQADALTLAVHGKYNGIRVVFDIELKNIISSTRYKVKFTSIDDNQIDIANNIQCDVVQWNNGVTIESTPNWE